MATTEDNQLVAMGECSNSIDSAKCTHSASWANNSENESPVINKQTNNLNSTPTSARFFVIKLTEGTFHNKSPFLINKGIQSVVGEPTSIKKLRSGELMIQVSNATQATSLLNCKTLANLPVSVSAHKTLNFSLL